MLKSLSVASPHDVYLWPDGFWCFREEYSDAYMRDNNYRLVAAALAEWFVVTKSGKRILPSDVG
jgi:hypothetical protein